MVETEMRAGIDALAAFGAIGFRAKAEEELACWLVSQHRGDEAEPFMSAARETYSLIGAAGWLAEIDARQTSLEEAPAATAGSRVMSGNT